MCGIYGTTLVYEESTLRSKMDRTSFRGPDYMGIKKYDSSSGSVTFAHNRLSIIDLDLRSNQPFEFHNLSIVFNGEIYNFLEVKAELVSKGHSFRTASDTEVICGAYLEWGKACLSRLNGMFAFVIFDKKTNKLFGARDRLGKKPFYYCLKNGFEFASQISGIQIGRYDLSISSNAITRYLAWNNVPDPDSIFNEVKKLGAGNYFEYYLENQRFEEKTYWDIKSSTANSFQGSYEEAVSKMDDLISDAVKGRLFADVPVGVFLSGGIDSSLIAALAAKQSPGQVKTFSIKFLEDGFDESQYAKAVADHLGTEHTTITCSVDEGLDLIQNVSRFYDEPFADASAIPSMLLAKYTKKYVTVALSGDGGDESFLGYARYKWTSDVNKAFRVPSCIRQPLGKLMINLPLSNLARIGRALSLQDIEEFYLYSLGGIDTSWIDLPVKELRDVDEVSYLRGTGSLVQRLGDFDLKTYLNWDINTKVDRASMSASLEARAPLLDYRVVELARSLPVDFKYRGDVQKRILKDILFRYAPRELFDRPKSGFTMPFKEWFRGGLKEYVLSSLNNQSLKDIPGIVPHKVELLISEHMSGSRNRYPQIWKLLVLQQWMEKNGAGLSVI